MENDTLYFQWKPQDPKCYHHLNCFTFLVCTSNFFGHLLHHWPPNGSIFFSFKIFCRILIFIVYSLHTIWYLPLKQAMNFFYSLEPMLLINAWKQRIACLHQLKNSTTKTCNEQLLITRGNSYEFIQALLTELVRFYGIPTFVRLFNAKSCLFNILNIWFVSK